MLDKNRPILHRASLPALNTHCARRQPYDDGRRRNSLQWDGRTLMTKDVDTRTHTHIHSEEVRRHSGDNFPSTIRLLFPASSYKERGEIAPGEKRPRQPGSEGSSYIKYVRLLYRVRAFQLAHGDWRRRSDGGATKRAGERFHRADIATGGTSNGGAAARPPARPICMYNV